MREHLRGPLSVWHWAFNRTVWANGSWLVAASKKAALRGQCGLTDAQLGEEGVSNALELFMVLFHSLKLGLVDAELDAVWRRWECQERAEMSHGTVE
jgi:hypothetical protein